MKKHNEDISKYRASHLECRMGMSGHSWRWVADFKVLRNTRGEITEFSRSRVCRRCKSESTKVYDGKTGTVLRRTYRYAEGYMTDADHAIRPGMASLEALRRSVEEGRVQE